MKSQNDLIISIVAAVLGIGCAATFFFIKPVPVQPAAPQAVVTTQLKLPDAAPTMTSGLKSGNANGGGMVGPGGMMGGMGMMGPGGPSAAGMTKPGFSGAKTGG
jgi:hypothetical protein